MAKALVKGEGPTTEEEEEGLVGLGEEGPGELGDPLEELKDIGGGLHQG